MESSDTGDKIAVDKRTGLMITGILERVYVIYAIDPSKVRRNTTGNIDDSADIYDISAPTNVDWDSALPVRIGLDYTFDPSYRQGQLVFTNSDGEDVPEDDIIFLTEEELATYTPPVTEEINPRRVVGQGETGIWERDDNA